jgi:hypothetical protein
MAKAHEAAYVDGAGDHHLTLVKLAAEHAKHHRDLLAQLSLDNTDGGGDVSSGIKAMLDEEFNKRFGFLADQVVPLPKNFSFVGQTESAVALDTGINSAGLRLVARPGHTEASADACERLVKEHGDMLRKFVEI